MKSISIFLFILVIFVRITPAQDSKKVLERQEEKGIDFSAIKDVLKNDKLETGVKKIKKKRSIKKKMAKAKSLKSYDIPNEKDFWSFFSELWLVQNASVLKWNFEKPDYGLGSYFKEFLEKQGVLEVHYKILIVDSPDITHYALPSENEVIFLLGLPFIRSMDLSRLEISLLLLEDYIRHSLGHFKTQVSLEGLNKYLGTNFSGKKFNKDLIQKLKEKYDEVIFAKGFTFQQQYKVTSSMNRRLKSDLKIWNAYYKLIQKKKNLVESNIIYKKYLKIYPSPELQLNWLSPVKKKIL